MKIQFDEKDKVLVASIQGEITITSATELRTEFKKLSQTNVVMNLSKVDYMDSSGLATLIEIQKHMKSKGGDIYLTHLTGKVRSLFEITKLDKLFSIYSDDTSAISQFK